MPEHLNVGKKFKFKMVGLDGNAFFILGRFQQGAKKAGWTAEQIKTVMDEATSGDYDHLLATMMEYTDAN